MKFLVSSQYLANQLKIIYDNGQFIVSITCYNNSLTMITNKWNTYHLPVKSIKLSSEIEVPEAIDQSSRRWDWIKDTLWAIPDQPIVITATDKNTNLILSF